MNRSFAMSVFAIAVLVCVAGCQSYSEKVTGGKSSANETAALGALRAIASAQTAYSVTHDGDYGTFGDLVKGGNLDVRFGGDPPILGGYRLTMSVTSKNSGTASYRVNADPQETLPAGSTGSRHFYLDSNDSAIHVNPKQPATSSDPTL